MTTPARPVLGIDASRMSADRTGIENYLHHLLPGLVTGWLASGGEVVLFSPSGGASFVADGVELRPGGGPGWTQLRLPSEARRARLDVYFSPIPVLPVIRRMPCPCVVTVHDLLEFQPRWWYFKRLVGRTLARSAAAICVSQATQAEVAASFPEAAPRTVVVREAADGTVFREGGGPDDEGELLRRVGVAAPPILAVGTIQPRKNYARLIRAYARLLPDRPSLPPLLVVGRPGWDFAEVISLPAELGIADRVVFAGQLDDAEVAALMRASVLLAAVSTGEGFGLPLVEAMYSGLPILAADIPPFREVAGNAAMFVNPLSVEDIAAGLATLVDDPAARARLREVARARKGLFSWDRAAAEVVTTLRAVLTAV